MAEPTQTGRGPAERPTDGQTADQTGAAEPGRAFPLAAAIAVGAAAVTLIVLLIPGLLVYPDAGATATQAEIDEAIAFERERNDGLRAELERIEGTLAGGVCQRDGAFFPTPAPVVGAPDAAGGGVAAADPNAAPGAGAAQTPEPEPIAALPADPAEQTPTPDALPDAEAFDGNLLQWIDQGTVLVIAFEGDVSFGAGSGFFVAPNTILTNGHVVGENASVVVVSGPGLGNGVRRVSVVARSDAGAAQGGDDFAILRLEEQPAPEIQPYKLAQTERLAPVIAAGYPGFLTDAELRGFLQSVAQQGAAETAPINPVTSQGAVNTIRSVGPGERIAHSATIYPGNSGGPLFDRCGQVIGVNTYGVSAQEGGDGGAPATGRVYTALYAQSSADAIRFLRANGIEPTAADAVCRETE